MVKEAGVNMCGGLKSFHQNAVLNRLRPRYMGKPRHMRFKRWPNLSVGAQVDEQLADGLDGLLGPSSEGGVLVVLQFSVATNTTSEAGVWNNLLLLSAVLEVCDSRVELSSLHRLGDVVGVLEMNAEVGDLALSG